jgi:alpha-galactosidase
MTKIAIIGAGSAVFPQQMIVDALPIPGLESGEFALIDIDPERLERSHELVELIIKKSGKNFSVCSSTKRASSRY